MYDSNLEASVADALRLPVFSVCEDASPDDVLAIVLSTKYRRAALTEASKGEMKDYVSSAMRARQPLKFYMMCGGYKQARLASSPEVDWAEAFNIKYITGTALRLATVYEPGVEVIYRHHTILLSEINNYPNNDFNIYRNQFNELLAYYQAQVPDHLRVSLRVEESHISEDYAMVFAKAKERALFFEAEFQRLDETTQTLLIDKSWRNIKWNGREDWTQLTTFEKNEKAKQALFLDQAFLANDTITSLPVHSDKLTVYFRPSPDRSRLQYGGCSSSSVQFWAGTGVFMFHKSRYVPWILSATQLAKTRLRRRRNIDMDLPECLRKKIYDT